MKMLCSIATAAMIGFGAAASAGEPVRLADESLDVVTAGFGLVSGAYTKNVFAFFGNRATISESSESNTTGKNGVFQTSSKANVTINAFGPGLVATGGSAGAFLLFGGVANGN